MLDVHAPHEGIHGIRDFFLHLFVITVGLLIALGLEGMVEWRHHVHLRREADANLRLEIEDNRKDLASSMAAMPAEIKNMQKIIIFLRIRQSGKVVLVPKLDLGVTISTLQDASWQTANATGALGLMDYRQVQRYAAVYQLQKKLDTLQDASFAPLITLGAYLGTEHPEEISKEDATAAILKVHELLAHLVAIRELGAGLDKTYGDALTVK